MLHEVAGGKGDGTCAKENLEATMKAFHQQILRDMKCKLLQCQSNDREAEAIMCIRVRIKLMQQFLKDTFSWSIFIWITIFWGTEIHPSIEHTINSRG